MATEDIVQTLSSLSLFADLSTAQLERVAHTFDEALFSAEQRVLRQGFTGTGFTVIVEGEAVIRIDGEDRARLARGDFFGEISALLGEPPTADVIAAGPLRCLTLAGGELQGFLTEHPTVMFRMLQAMARRQRSTLGWRN